MDYFYNFGDDFLFSFIFLFLTNLRFFLLVVTSNTLVNLHILENTIEKVEV